MDRLAYSGCEITSGKHVPRQVLGSHYLALRYSKASFNITLTIRLNSKHPLLLLVLLDQLLVLLSLCTDLFFLVHYLSSQLSFHVNLGLLFFKKLLLQFLEVFQGKILIFALRLRRLGQVDIEYLLPRFRFDHGLKFSSPLF